MSLQSSESQLKEALAALGELKALTEGLKASAESKPAEADRLQKIESALEEYKASGASLAEKMLAFEQKLESLAKMKVEVEEEDEDEDEDMEKEANELGGVNQTVISKKKKKKVVMAKKDEDELMDEKVEKKSKYAAEAKEDEEGEDESEMEDDAKEKAAVPPQFLKNIKKKKEEMKKEDESSEKAAEPMEDSKDKAKCGPKGKLKAEEVISETVAESNAEQETKVEEPAVEAQASEAAPAAVAEEAPAAAPVAVEQAPAAKAEEVAAPVTATVAEIKEEVVVANASKEAPAPQASATIQKDETAELLAKELAAKNAALAEVSKMKAEFDSLMERIAKVEAAEKSAEAKVAKAVAQIGVEPVVSSADVSDDKPLTPDEVWKQYFALQQTDAKEARKFYLKHEDTIRSAAFGKTKKYS